MRRIPRPVPADPDADPAEAAAVTEANRLSRRGFIRWTVGAAALGTLAALGGIALQTGSRAVSAIRDALHLPHPAVPAPPIPAGADLHEPGLVPLVTPNRDFYRIDTAVVVPQIDPANWKLHIHGMVDREVTLSWDELLALPLEESYTTLTCVSNPIGGNLAGNALWLGYPIRHLLERAGVSPSADMVLSRSQDGFTASTPLEALTDDRNAILAIGMNGKALPIEHGFPVRMVVPGLYGYVSATKWVVDLKVTRFDTDTAFWTTQGYAARAPVKLMSRIDLPATGQTDLAPGPRYLGGVAWYQHIGIERVEIQVDGGDFHEAELGTAISDDTWVQWRWKWDATPGIHSVRVRAIGKDGEVQTGHQQGAIPDGATGWHEVDVNVAKPQ